MRAIDGHVGLRAIQTSSRAMQTSSPVTANKRARKLNKRKSKSIESTRLPASLISRVAEGTRGGGEGMMGAVGAIGRLHSLKRERMSERMITETQAEIETCGEEELYKLPFYVGRSLPYEAGGWAVPLTGACL